MNTKNKKTEKEEKTSGAEKPISLWGASFTEVLGALLKTKPMPKRLERREGEMTRISIERQNWILLVLSVAHGKSLTPIQLQKSLFLLSKRITGINKGFYKFKPYDYGPFDLDIYKDAEQLEIDEKIIISFGANLRQRVYTNTIAGEKLAEEIKKKLTADALQINDDTVKWVESQSFHDLVQTIYREYPDFRVNSIFRG